MLRHRRFHAQFIRTALVAVVAFSIGSAGVALGLVANGVIEACYQNVTGNLRLETAQKPCIAGSETRISWNQVGPKGDKGDQGIQGVQGIQGPAGPAGPAGPSGLPSFDALDGLPCTTPELLSSLPSSVHGFVRLRLTYVGDLRLRRSVTLSCRYEGPRLVDLGLGVFDTSTGLLWEKKNGSDGLADRANLHDVDNRYTFCEAGGHRGGITSIPPFEPVPVCDLPNGWIAAVNNERFMGLMGWTLPSPSVPHLQIPFDEETGLLDPIFGPQPPELLCHWGNEAHVVGSLAQVRNQYVAVPASTLCAVRAFRSGFR